MSSHKEEIALDVQRDGVVNFEPQIRGRWNLLIVSACFLVFIMLKLPIVTYGVLYSRILTPEVPSLITGSVFNVHQLCWDSAALFAEALCSSFGWRKVAFASGAVVGLSYILSFFVNDGTYLILTHSVLNGVGSGIAAAVCNFVVPMYFDKRRGLAVGFMYTGFSAGDLIAPPLVYYLQHCVGEKGALLIIGALMFNICAASMLFHPVDWHMGKSRSYSSSKQDVRQVGRRNSSSPRLSTGSVNYSATITTGAEEAVPHVKKSMLALHKIGSIILSTFKNLEMLRSFKMLLVVTSFSLVIVSFLNYIMLIPFSLKNRGHEVETTIWCLSILGICNVIVRIFVTALSDVLPISKMIYYMAGSAFIGISAIVFGMVNSITWLSISMVLLGSGVAICYPLIPLLIIELFGMQQMPKVFGVTGFAIAVGFIVLGPFVGLMRDSLDNYELTIQLLSAPLFLSFCLWFLLPMAGALDIKRLNSLSSDS